MIWTIRVQPPVGYYYDVCEEAPTSFDALSRVSRREGVPINKCWVTGTANQQSGSVSSSNPEVAMWGAIFDLAGILMGGLAKQLVNHLQRKRSEAHLQQAAGVRPLRTTLVNRYNANNPNGS